MFITDLQSSDDLTPGIEIRARKRPPPLGETAFSRVAARAGRNYELGNGKTDRYKGENAP